MYFIRLGYMLTAVVLVAFLIFNLIFEAFPYDMMMVIALYYVFLSAIWFSVTVMYILEREFTFAGLIAFGIGIVYVLFEIVGLDIIVAQVIALLIVSLLGLLLIIYFSNLQKKRWKRG